MIHLSKEVAAQVLRATVKGKRHPYYARVTELADIYLPLLTGENIEPLLRQFNPREDDEMFAQRKRITKTIVGAVSGKVKGPFEKVTRSNNVTKKLVFTGDNTSDKLKDLESVLEEYWGDETLDDYMEQRILDLSFEDPNSFIITEMIEVDDKVHVFPFEVTSYEAVNYNYVNNMLEYLVVFDGDKKHTMYTTKFNVVLVEVKNFDDKKEKKKIIPGVMITSLDDAAESKDLTNITFDKKIYNVWVIENPCDEIQAIRVGYKRDEMTGGNTFVSPMQKAIPRLRKIIKSDSELDLVISLHAFPQKLQYAQRCQGDLKNNKICDHGKVRGKEGVNCTVCKGSGFLFHTSAQSALTYAMPTQNELNSGVKPMELDKLIAYKHPDINIIKFENEYTRQLEDQVITDVYISQTLQRINGTPTATEVTFDMQNVYDTLYPFARKYSTIYKKQVRLAACYVGIDKDLTVVHQFPKDFKLKTISQLLDELKKAKDADAPEFFKKQLNDDVAMKIWHDDPTALLKYQVKQQHMPFAGKSAQEVSDIIAAGRSTKEKTLLWVEFENIMQTIEDKQFNLDEPVFFYDLPYEERVRLIQEEMVLISQAKITELGISPLDLGDGELSVNEIPKNIDVESESKAKLRGTVRGVSGIIAINQAVGKGEMTEKAAEAMLIEVYGFSEEQAAKLIEPVPLKPQLPNPA